ncbi:hypothetical protein EV122DRAFT_220178 [Schizophyllum commune]
MRAEDLLEQATSVANLDLQRSGFVPSASETQRIHEMSRELSSEVSTIDAEIERLHGLRERVLRQLDVHKSITSPIRSLPPELLSEIFGVLYDDELESSGKAYITVYILSCICSEWRANVRSTPRLWVDIPTMVRGPKGKYHSHLDRVVDHISLSGRLPLRLSHQEPAGNDLLGWFLRELRPHLTRIGYIEIDTDCWYCDKELNDLQLPNLAQATLVIQGPPFPLSLGFLASANDLRLAKLFHRYIGPFNYAPELRLPTLPTLTSLCLDFSAIIAMNALTEALYACRSGLRFLSMNLRFTRDPYTSGPLELTALEGMHLGETSYTFLEHIATPSLEVLFIWAVIELVGNTHAGVADGDPFPSLSAFVSRIPRPRRLKCVRVGATTRNVDTFLGFLNTLDDLEQLHIEDREYTGLFSEDLLTWLTCVDDQEPHLPHLKKIELYLRRRPRLSKKMKGALERMLESRKNRRVCAAREVAAMESLVEYL